MKNLLVLCGDCAKFSIAGRHIVDKEMQFELAGIVILRAKSDDE